MSRLVLMLALIFLVLCTGALAHPGHGEAEHFQFGPIVVLAVLVVACALFRWRSNSGISG